MADGITKRLMQAQEDANDDLAAKSYKHTSAYQLINSGNPANPTTQPTSGSAIRRALLRRAKAKELGLDKMKYDTSRIAKGAYQSDTFDQADSENRKSILGTADVKKHQEKTKRERILTTERKQQYNATGDASDPGATNASSNSSTRQSFNSRRDSFIEPPSRNYNPYA